MATLYEFNQISPTINSVRRNKIDWDDAARLCNVLPRIARRWGLNTSIRRRARPENYFLVALRLLKAESHEGPPHFALKGKGR
jgi:hypothetical protein